MRRRVRGLLADESDDLLPQSWVVDECERLREDISHGSFTLGQDEVHDIPEVRRVRLAGDVLQRHAAPVESNRTSIDRQRFLLVLACARPVCLWLCLRHGPSSSCQLGATPA
ncbi:Uncharacterised protein [Mycobacteroides abscessus subsp. abscessus]|nr:Uncharacterised protein [Mycobacteroides abscessus subsp. abscessus]